MGLDVGMDAWLDNHYFEKAVGMREPSQLTEAREILSCLVAQVYAADGGNFDSASKIWKELGYEKEELDEVFEEQDIRAARWCTCKIRVMVFRRGINVVRRDIFVSTSNDERRPWQLPKYVVAIRGTKPCKVDLKDDIRIAFETLHTSLLYGAIMEMINVVSKKHPQESVCVTGHSLGAAFGLLVTRKLALEGRVLETHLFNPPFLSIDTLLEKGWNAVKTLVAPIAMMKPLGKVMKAGKEAAKKKLHSAIGSERDAQYLKARADEFSRLQEWTPNLYVNSRDPICNGYIHHFDKVKNIPNDHPDATCRSTSTSARILRKVTQLMPSPIVPNSIQLIPVANLCSNDTKSASWRPSKKLMCAHELAQWHANPSDLNLRYEYVNLVEQGVASGPEQ